MVRSGSLADVDAIDAFDPFAGDRREELANGRCLVAECDGRVVAYLAYSPAGFIGRPFIHFLAVAREHRRRGIATELLAAAQARVGTGRVFISTGESNQVMLALLAGQGWIPAGCVQGVNTNGSAECFFYRDLDPA